MTASDHLRTVVSVRFPGVLRDVLNPNNAIAALGGDDAVRANVTAVATLPRSEYVNVPPLNLTLRPGDSTSTSNILSAEPKPMKNTFALRVFRSTTTTTTNDDTFMTYKTSLLGNVQHTVPFNGIADWAYVGHRTLDAAKRAISELDTKPMSFANAPDRVPIGPRKWRRTKDASWRPRLPFEMRTQRAVDIARFIELGLYGPKRMRTTVGRDKSTDSREIVTVNETERNDDGNGKKSKQNDSSGDGETSADIPRIETATNNTEIITRENNRNVESNVDSTTTTATTESTNRKNIEGQLQVMELCRPWRFSRTGIELAQTDYFFQQQSYQRSSVTGGEFNLGFDRRSDATRLISKPWKVAADAENVPSRPPSPSVLRAHSHGHGVIPRRIRNRELLFVQLKRLFEERPVWIRRNVCQHVEPDLHPSFCHTARRVGYSFYGAGPFMQAWVRYGYDPRKDAGSRGFQVVDLRLNNPVVVEAIKVQFAKVKAHMAVQKRNTSFAPDYTLKEVPTFRHLFLQLCDIEIPEVQRLVVQEKYPEQFNSKFGYFTEEGLGKVIKAIRKGVYEKAVEMLGEKRAKHIVDEYIRVRKRRRQKFRLLPRKKEMVKEIEGVPSSLIHPGAAAKLSKKAGRNVVVPEIEEITPKVMEVRRDEGGQNGEGDDVDGNKIMNFEEVECFEVLEDEDDDNNNDGNDDDMVDQDDDDDDDDNWLDEE